MSAPGVSRPPAILIIVGSADTSQVPNPATMSHRSIRIAGDCSHRTDPATVPEVMVSVRDVRHMRAAEKRLTVVGIEEAENE